MRKILLLRFATDPVARICSGVNPVIIPADTVEGAPAYYLGGGRLCSIPDIEHLINGAYQRLDITLSGISADTQAIFKDESHTLYGAAVHVGFAYQDNAWQITEVEWLAELIAGAPTMGSKPGQDGRSKTIGISIGTDWTDRTKAPIAYWTHADQQRRSPGDRMFDHVSALNAGTSRPFSPTDAKS